METTAFVLTQKGEAAAAFSLQTISLPALTETQVLVATEGFGLNYADVMARRGLYREAPPMPCVIGYEAVGTVTAVGSEKNAHLVGKRVVAFCRFGGYAKHVVTEAHGVAEIGGMDGAEAPRLAFGKMRSNALVTDIVYVPLVTPFLAQAQEVGLATVDGLGMLLHQAVPGFEKWFGKRPKVTPELRQLVLDDIEAHA